MASYVAIYGAKAGIGHDRLEAVVVADDNRVSVYGPSTGSGLADSISEDIDWDFGDPETTLRLGLTGLSYYHLDGPHTFEGDLPDVGDAIAKIYGVSRII